MVAGGLREKTCGLINLFLGDIAQLCGPFRAVIFQKGPVGIEVGGFAVRPHEVDVTLPEAGIIQFLVDDDPRHAVHQSKVGTGPEGDVHVRDARGIGAARIRHDDLDSGSGLPAPRDTPEKHGMRFGCIGADDEETGSRVNIGIGSHGVRPCRRTWYIRPTAEAMHRRGLPSTLLVPKPPLKILLAR